jgi:Response regulator receiver domain
MDMRMSVMDGYDATKHIKSTTKGNTTVVITLTASVLEEEKAIVLSAACDDFLRKPFAIWVKSLGNIGGTPPHDWISDLPQSQTQGSTFYFTLIAKAIAEKINLQKKGNRE